MVNFYAYGQIYIGINCPILKNNLAIWSHWQDREGISDENSHSAVLLVRVLALAVPRAVHPLAVVHVSVRISVHSVPVLHVVLVISLKFGPGRLHHEKVGFYSNGDVLSQIVSTLESLSSLF